MVEICQNPFKRDKCKSETIKLYIEYKHKILPICYECWSKIAVSKHEWGDSPKPNFDKREIIELE